MLCPECQSILEKSQVYEGLWYCSEGFGCSWDNYYDNDGNEYDIKGEKLYPTIQEGYYVCPKCDGAFLIKYGSRQAYRTNDLNQILCDKCGINLKLLTEEESTKHYIATSGNIDSIDYKDGDPKAHAGNKKLTMTNIPLTMLPLVSVPMNDGARPDKYGKYNWLTQPDESMDLMVYLNGIMRHIMLYMAGQDYTSDTSVHHLTAIAAGVSVASDALFFGKMKDTRVKLSEKQLKKYEELLNQTLKDWL